MTEKRFTNIEHDYENAWIKCNDNGDFMIYAIYKELDESLPSLEDLLNGLSEENEQLKCEVYSYKCSTETNKEIIEDLHKEYKVLEKENKELQYKLRKCEDARQSYKQDWKACSSYCDEYKSKIISLKDEVEGLIEENKELKKQVDEMINIFNDSGLDYHISDELEEILND